MQPKRGTPKLSASDPDLRKVYKQLPLDERHAVIAAMFRENPSQKLIAEKLGINASTVSRVLDTLMPDRDPETLAQLPKVTLTRALPEMVALKRVQDALGRLAPASRARVLEAVLSG